MVHRHPRGGGIPVATTLAGLLGACVVLLFLLGGCSSDDWDDDCCAEHPRYHTVTIILNVSDVGGRALGEATVWVNGVAQAERTSWQFVTLGSDFPPEWRGFQANWIKGGFTVATYGYDDAAEIKVAVSKSGFFTQATTFTIADWQPSVVYAKDTFIMEASPYPTTAGVDEPRMKPTPGEVIGWEPPQSSSATPSVFKLVQGARPEEVVLEPVA